MRVYPDLPAARRIATSVRRSRFRDQGLRGKGPLGLGTEFERVRDYSPDDDIRQVNWLATARMDRPMSNDYRVEQDRDLIAVVDAGRLMASPIGDATRLDVAMDALCSLAAVADEIGDRFGALVFDSEVRRYLPPARGGGALAVNTLFDIEPEPVDSDYVRAFQRVESAKRAWVVVFTDLLEEVAARSLIEGVPVLARKHSVAVATARDPDIEAALTTAPSQPLDAYRSGGRAGRLRGPPPGRRQPQPRGSPAGRGGSERPGSRNGRRLPASEGPRAAVGRATTRRFAGLKPLGSQGSTIWTRSAVPPRLLRRLEGCRSI